MEDIEIIGIKFDFNLKVEPYASLYTIVVESNGKQEPFYIAIVNGQCITLSKHMTLENGEPHDEYIMENYCFKNRQVQLQYQKIVTDFFLLLDNLTDSQKEKLYHKQELMMLDGKKIN